MKTGHRDGLLHEDLSAHPSDCFEWISMEDVHMDTMRRFFPCRSKKNDK